MKRHLLLSALACSFILHAVLARSQQLTVQNGDGKQTVFTKADLEALPRAQVKTSVSGTATAFEGVALRAVLEKAGIALGETMRGKRLASYLLVEAADDYRVVFALPELDTAFTDKQIVLAFLKDGKPLDDKEGAYRIVIPEEKRMARWVRQVRTLKILNAP
jgi:hypothetical protein